MTDRRVLRSGVLRQPGLAGGAQPGHGLPRTAAAAHSPQRVGLGSVRPYCRCGHFVGRPPTRDTSAVAALWTIDALLTARGPVSRVIAAGASALAEDVMLEVLAEAGPLAVERLLVASGGGYRCGGIRLDDQVARRAGEELRVRMPTSWPATRSWLAGRCRSTWRRRTRRGTPRRRLGCLQPAARRATAGRGWWRFRLSRLIRGPPRGRLFAAAGRLGGLPFEWLTSRNLDDAGADDRGEALRAAKLTAGCLMLAADVVVDELFDDVAALTRADEDDEPADLNTTFVLSGLPSRFARHYTPRFARRFLVAMVDVTRRLTAGWEPLSCVAEELAVRALLDEVEVQADVADIELDRGWRGHLEEHVFDDVDHELLYDPALDGIEDQPALGPPGMAPMSFDWWFVPFNPDRPLPPYILDDRPDAV